MNFSSHCSQIYCLALQFFTKSFDVYIEFSFHFHFHCLRQRHILSTFCSIIKLCINKDNLLVPLQSATPISVCQMRKFLKLSVRVEFQSGRVLPVKRLFIHPCIKVCAGFSKSLCSCVFELFPLLRNFLLLPQAGLFLSSVGLGSKRLSEAGFSGVGWAGEAWASGTVLASAGQGFGRLTITILYHIHRTCWHGVTWPPSYLIPCRIFCVWPEWDFSGFC